MAKKLPAGETRSSSGLAAVTLDPDSRVLIRGDVLHVVSRRGYSSIRGANFGKLHEQILPLLDGRFSRSQLLAASRFNERVVRDYLKSLTDIGALASPRSANLPRGFPHPSWGLQTSSTPRVRLAVSLDESRFQACSEARTVTLLAVDQPTLHQEILNPGLSETRNLSRLLLLCGGGGLNEQELLRRTAVARHILALELGKGCPSSFAVFELHPHKLAVERLAYVRTPRVPWSSLPKQLGLVRLAACDQLPLVVMTSALPGHTGTRLKFGLDANDVRSSLLVEHLGRESLIQAARGGTLQAKCHYLGSRPKSESVLKMTPEFAELAIACSSELELNEKLLGSWAQSSLGFHSGGRHADLLSIAPPSQRVGVLQQALRSYRDSYPGTFYEGHAPLLVFRSPAFSVSRLGFEETIAEALVRAIAGQLDPKAGNPSVCVPTLRGSATIRRRLRNVLLRLPSGIQIVAGHFRWLGIKVHFGLNGVAS